MLQHVPLPNIAAVYSGMTYNTGQSTGPGPGWIPIYSLDCTGQFPHIPCAHLAHAPALFEVPSLQQTQERRVVEVEEVAAADCPPLVPWRSDTVKVPNRFESDES